MPPLNEPVKPTAFEPSNPEPAPPQQIESAGGPPRWVLPTLGVLLALAFIVIFWLPGRFDGGAAELASTDNATSIESAQLATNPAKPEASATEASPWSDAQLAKLRKEAQDVLAVLLDVQYELEEIGVQVWAKDAFEASKSVAAQGDTAYRDRQFIEAKDRFEQALTQLELLAESSPEVLAGYLERARQYIEAGEQQSALDALAIATLIAPVNTDIASVTNRAEMLTQLLPLLAKAQEAEEAGDLGSAETFLQQATALDLEHLGAEAEFARVKGARTLERFNRAMSDGYRALDEGQFSRARTAFMQAGKLSPGSPEVRSALADFDIAETNWRLSTLQARGKEQEASEQWQEAVKTFEKALAIDSSLVFVQQGLKRSRARAQLDKQFSTAIEQPARLSDKAVADATAQLMRQAGSISPRGPVLEKQLAVLETLLEQAAAQIQLTLRSDGQTEVTLRRVSRLGAFQQKVLILRPGTYIAIGSRDGYRDVRRTFTLDHDSVAFDLEIVCREQI
jgi:tetratricopeptide (TPR) repeat protein